MQRITKIIHMPQLFKQAGVKTEKVEAKGAIDVNGKQKRTLYSHCWLNLNDQTWEKKIYWSWKSRPIKYLKIK